MRAEQLSTCVTVLLILLLAFEGLILAWRAIPLLKAVDPYDFPSSRHLSNFLRPRDFFLLTLVMQMVAYGV